MELISQNDVKGEIDIPEGWEEVPIGSIASFTSGSFIRTSTLGNKSSNFPIPVYGGNGISGYTDKFISDKATIVIGRVGQKCGTVYLTKGPVWISDNALYPKQYHASVDLSYLALAIEAAKLNEIRLHNDLPLITQSVVHQARILLPKDESEQRAIATALSDVDALIDSLDGLIAKKRAIKQGAMQQLLTGKKRLPGFNRTWEKKTLGDLFIFKNGLNKGKEFFGTGTPIVNYMDVYRNAGLTVSNLKGKVSVSSTELNNFDVRKGDVFFTRTSETVDEIGIASVMLEKPQDTVFSGFILRARPKGEHLIDGFKKYCFASNAVRSQITSKSTYTTRALTNGKILSAISLNVPDQKEQKAIAAILSDMDAEIAALEARRDKTRTLKQGMMQELLTGKTRLL